MGKLNVVLDDEREKKFRKVVYETKGYKKGNISEAIEEAIDCWIDEQLAEQENQAKTKKE